MAVHALFPAQWRQKIQKMLSCLLGQPGFHNKTVWVGKEGQRKRGRGLREEGEKELESVMNVGSLAKHYFEGLWFQFYVWVLS